MALEHAAFLAVIDLRTPRCALGKAASVSLSFPSALPAR